MKDLAILILAAGNGTRMLSNKPKILHEIASRPIISYIIETAKKISDNVVIVLNEELHHNQELSKIILSYNIRTAIQHKQLGTADAVRNGIVDIDNTYTLVLYGDVPFIEENTLRTMCETIEQDHDLAILGFDYDQQNQYGKILLIAPQIPAKILEYTHTEYSSIASNYVYNSGIILAKTELLREFFSALHNKSVTTKELYLTDIIEFCYDKKYQVRLHKAAHNEVIGINDKKQLATAEKILQTKLRNYWVERGVIMIDPEKVFIDPSVTIQEDATIHPYVFLGRNVHIKSSATILPFSHLEGVVVEPGCVIGPFSRIRSNSHIKDNAKIGNFTEIKNTIIGKSSKASHFSYIGDVLIGDRVNVGAGAVFCNYDGKEKHQSIVEDEAFIGSNSSIISPINIGRNAFVGAGSVITTDVPNNSLAVARSVQKNALLSKK